MLTLLDRKNISSRTNCQVAARRVTGLIIKRLWLDCLLSRSQRLIGAKLVHPRYTSFDWGGADIFS